MNFKTTGNSQGNTVSCISACRLSVSVLDHLFKDIWIALEDRDSVFLWGKGHISLLSRKIKRTSPSGTNVRQCLLAAPCREWKEFPKLSVSARDANPLSQQHRPGHFPTGPRGYGEPRRT